MTASPLAFFVIAASVFASTLPGITVVADAPAPVVAEAPAASEDAPETRRAARIVLRSKKVVAASIALHTRDGEVVRTYRDELLWKGRTVLTLDVSGLPFGAYNLVITTPHGTQTSPIVI